MMGEGGGWIGYGYASRYQCWREYMAQCFIVSALTGQEASHQFKQRPLQVDRDPCAVVGEVGGPQGQRGETDQLHLHGSAHEEGAATLLPSDQEACRFEEDKGTCMCVCMGLP